MIQIYKKHHNLVILLSILGVLLISSIYLQAFAGNSPIISWNPEKVEAEVFPGGIRQIETSFTSNIDLENIEFNIAPPLRPFITIEPSNLSSVDAGEEVKINIVVAPDIDTSLRKFSGIIQIRGTEKENVLLGSLYSFLNKPQKARIIAKPLLVKFEVVSAQPALDLFEEFLIEEFGTLQPPIEFEGDAPPPLEVPQEISEAFKQGTDGSFYLSIGSFIYNGPFITNTDAESGLFNLLDELELEGVVVDDLRTALNGHDMHTEDTEEMSGLRLSENQIARIFFPFSVNPFRAGYHSHRQAGSSFFSIVHINDENTHALHRQSDIESLKNRDFFRGNTNLLNDGAQNGLHELMHAFIFRTNCFTGSKGEEEEFIGNVNEGLIVLRVAESFDDYNDLLSSTISDFPEGKECLDRLGLDFISETGGESPWPQFQHDSRHTGQSEFQGPQTNNIKWRFPANFLKTPAVGPDETIYVGATDLNSQRRFFALNSDGSVKWKSIPLSANPTSPAVIADDIVLVVTGTVDFGTRIYAFEDTSSATDKQPLWEHIVGERVEFVTKAADNTLYLTTENGELFSLTPTEQGVIENWRVTVANNLTPLRSSPAIGLDGKIYVTDLKTVFHTPKLIAVSPNGTIAWTRNIGGNTAPSALVLDDGTIVLAGGGGLRGFNPDGTDAFSINLGVQGTSTLPILLPNSNIAVGITDNSDNSFLIKADPNTEEVKSVRTIGSYQVLSTPVTDSEGTVYIAAENSPDSDIFAFNSDNSLKFSKRFTSFLGEPVIGSQNSLYMPVFERTDISVLTSLVKIGE